MTTKPQNRCSVILKQKDEQIGTFRPTQEIFYEIQKELEPYRTLYEKPLKSNKIYTVILKQDDIKMGSYKISPQRFHKLHKTVEPFRSLPAQSKNVRCVETGKIFKNAREASRWLSYINESYFNTFSSTLIKQCCRGKQKTSYGYHWEFVK